MSNYFDKYVVLHAEKLKSVNNHVDNSLNTQGILQGNYA